MHPSSFLDRSLAAMLGLALGDAFGRPLEFVGIPAVRTHPVDVSPGQLHWTDDTQMSLYLAEAVLAQGPDVLDDDALGDAIGARFSAWLDDPLTYDLAPGTTCLAGARAWRAGRDWRRSGVAGSDGCGAVMRVAPVAIAYAGGELDRAAAISARVTHAHRNAVEAAVAACRLLRSTLERGVFDAALVEAVAGGLPEGTVADALRAAIVEARAPSGPWLDEAAIPAGDGGWRSPSALGLAVAAALRWGHDFAAAVEGAARIGGDSDSVAALAGMFVGAARGSRALPTAWLEALPERARIEGAARALAARGQPILAIADVHGHLDHLDEALAWARAHAPLAQLVLLGDYCDNGPDIPGTLARVAEAVEDGAVALMGNHDLACLQALARVGEKDGPDWWRRWSGSHWNHGQDTPAAYGADTAAALGAHMPAAHRALLASLPWCHDSGRYLFVHAGMREGDLAPQVEALLAKVLPKGQVDYPDQLRGHTLTQTSDPSWSRVVVSAHEKGVPAPAFVASNRLTLKADVDAGGPLRAVLLPERRFLVFRGGR